MILSYRNLRQMRRRSFVGTSIIPKDALSKGSAFGKYQRIDQLEFSGGTTQIIYLEGGPLALHLIRHVFTHEYASTGVPYLVTSE
jgi:hypothetical protein